MENLLERALIFINRWSYVFYGVGALGLILYFRRAREAFHQRRYTPFHIEREEASATLRDALLIMLVIIAILGTTFYIDRILLGDLPSAGADIFNRTFFATPTPPAIGVTEEESQEEESQEDQNQEDQSQEGQSQEDQSQEDQNQEDQSQEENLAESNQENSPESPPESTATPEESISVEETATPTIEPTEEPFAACEVPGVIITSPTDGEVVSGNIAIIGSATIDGFESYQIEYGKGISPDAFELLGENSQPVEEGQLMEWGIEGLESGVWTLRLTVLNDTGNSPTPCEIAVVIR